MLKAIFIMVGLLTSGLIQAQTIFQKVYGQVSIWGGTWGSSARQTSDGGYIISGFTSDSLGVDAAYVVKTDYLGQLQWSEALSDTTFEPRARVIHETSDGGYIVIGYDYASYIVLWKLDGMGNITWAKRFIAGTAPTQVYCNYGEPTSDGGYIIIGNVVIWPSNNVDAELIKIDSNGNLTWAKIIGNGGPDGGNYVTQTSDGGYIITGTTGYPATNITLVKSDSTGNITWAKIFNSAYDVGNCVRQTSDGGYIIVGYTGLGPFNYNDVYLIKTDSSGNLLWSKTYGGTNEDEGYSVQQTSDGGYIIAGASYSFGAGNYDAYLIKTDSAGNVLWSNVFGGPNSDSFNSVQRTTDGGYVLAGISYSFGMTSLAYVVKTDSLGVSECFEHEAQTIKTNPLTQSNPYSYIVTSDGVMDSAIAVGSPVGTEIVLCEYDAIIESTIHHNQIFISPNPATSELRIENSELKIKEIEIYNTVGEKVSSQPVSSNPKQVTISVADFLPGIYFITVTDQAGNKVTKKIVKM
jgi:hypothetical protein